jgi:NitT/TauT family transport system substrate-binding protein
MDLIGQKMRALCLPLSRRAFLGAMVLAVASPASAAPAIRLAAQKTGTFAWELDVIADRGLDKAAEVAIETAEFASPQAAELALLAGQVDIIISDWLYVSRARSLGERLTFYPYSSAIGAIMTPPASAIASLGDLKGKTLAVAGGPLDKSWLIVQGASLRDGLDLKTEASIVYGAPSLLAAKARQGEFSASLNFWNFCAELEAEGFHRLVGVEELAITLGATGPLTNLGYVFNEDWARRNEGALARFLEMTRKAKDILADTPEEWERLKPRLNLRDAGALTVLRQRYGQGIPRRSVEAEEADARTLYALLARLGGAELVGKASELDPGTFYKIGKGG